MKIRWMAIAMALVVAGCAVAPPAPQQVWIVRHAEKQAGDDPALTPAGEARAQALAQLRFIPQRVFSTDTRRTRSTALPTASRWQLPVEIYDHRDPAALAARVLESGENTLIVGHSNTIAGLAAAFGVDPGREVRENEYDRLYVITLRPEGAIGEIRRYGDAPLMRE